MLTLEVTTEIFLQIASVADAVLIYQALKKEKKQFRAGLPWLENIYALKDCQLLLKRVEKSLHAGKSYLFTIFYLHNFAGMIAIQAIDNQNKKASLGFWLASQYYGRGILTKSVRKILKFAFSQLQLHRLELRVAAENSRSQHLLTKLGFVKEGELRESLKLDANYTTENIYALLSSNWEKTL